MSIIRTYQFKLKPTKKQALRFERWLGVCRLVYNMGLEIKDAWYKKRCVSMSKGDLQKQITDIRSDWDWMEDVHSQVLQEVMDRLFRAYDSFFRRIKERKMGKKVKPGYPRFAKKSSFVSFGFKQAVKLHPNTNTITLPKIGNVKFRKSKDVAGKIIHTRVIKKADGWYLSLITELDVDILPVPTPMREYIANDLGLIHLIVDSDGYKIPTPKHYRKSERKLKKLQRSLSRKKLGGSNWKKAKNKVARLHKKIADSRKDFLHKISSMQVNENQVIGFEDLNIAGMVQNKHLSKSILDAGWGTLISMTKYKSEWCGRTMVKLNRFFPSSKKCSNQECDYVADEMPLNQRKWICPKCNTEHDRDENASKNLEYELKKAVGHTVTALDFRKEDNVVPLPASFDAGKFDMPRNL